MSTRIVFSTSSEWLSGLIRIVTWSEFSHCELLLDDDVLIGADYPNGVGYSSLSVRKASSPRWAVCEVACADPAAVHAFARSQLGRPYDLSGALGIWFRRATWDDPRAWWCSELVAAAHVAAGVELVRTNRRRITQQDIYQSPLLRTVDSSANKQ